MEIAIFNEITTEDLLIELEAEARKYNGLYVDMENAPERKYVKDKASHISGLLKQLGRARIDKSKSYKTKVEAEADKIKDRLVNANVPFQALIDEHKAERAKLLALKKASDEAKEAALQLPIDHEEAIRENKLFDFELAEKESERIVYEKQLKADAIAESQQALINAELQAKEDKAQADERAKQAEIKRVADVERARVNEVNRQAAELKAQQDAENARLADTANVRTVNRAIFSAFIDAGLEKGAAAIATQALIDNKIPHTQINY
tara:strand:- start:4983 stop:5777 length:795 start_codon:yes stop_codon:yes gene_type:complete